MGAEVSSRVSRRVEPSRSLYAPRLKPKLAFSNILGSLLRRAPCYVKKPCMLQDRARCNDNFQLFPVHENDKFISYTNLMK